MRDARQLRWVGFCGVLLLVGATQTARTLGGAALLAIGIAGMGLLVLAWVLLGRVVTGSDDAPTTRWLRWTLALWSAPLLVARPLFSGDVFSYLAQGEIAARGLDPYTTGPAGGLGIASVLVERVSVYWRETPSPYGPLFGVLQRWISGPVGESSIAGVLAYRFVALAGLGLVIWAVPRLARRAGASERVALWLGVLNPLVLWHFVAGVHNDALMIGLMLAGTTLALDALGDRIDGVRLIAGMVLIVLGADVKLPAVVALAVVGTALARRWGGSPGRLVLGGAAMVFVFLFVSTAVSWCSGFGFGWVRTLGTSGVINSWMAPTNWFGFLTGGVAALFGGHVMQPMIGLGRLLGDVLMVGGIAVVIGRQLSGRLAPLPSLGAMLSLVVVFGPAVHPWYLLWAAIPLAVCLPPGRARLWVVGLIAVFSVVLPPLTGSATQLVLGYVGGAALVALCLPFLLRTGTETPAPQREKVSA